jgi:signal transduction histidine kinase
MKDTFRSFIFCWKYYFVVILIQSCTAIKVTATDSLQYNISHYTDENGLPQNSIKSLVRDEQGFVWMATEEGLVRFDGRNFRVYNNRVLPLRSNRLVTIVPDRNSGDLLALVDGRQCLQIRNGTALIQSDFTGEQNFDANHYKKNKISSYITVGQPDIYEKTTGFDKYIIPVGSTSYYSILNGGIEYYKEQKRQTSFAFRFTSYQGFFSMQGLLYYMDPSNNHLVQIEKDSVAVKKITGDILRNPVFKSGKGLLKLFWNRSSGQVFFSLGQNIYIVKRLPTGDLHTQCIVNDFDPAKNDIYHILYDEQRQLLFLGSITQGLYFFSRKQFLSLFMPGLDNQTFYAQTAYDDHRLITPNGYILGLNGDSILPQMGKRIINDKYSIITDTSGNIWTKAREKLYYYRRQNDGNPEEWNLQDGITQLYRGLDGTIWIGMKTQGLRKMQYRADGTKFPEVFLNSPMDVTCMVQETKNILWVGGAKGIYFLDLSTRHIDSLPELKGIYVRSIYCPREGEVWITTYGNGFYLYSNKRLTKFPEDRNNYLSIAHCFLEDKNGYCWISTNKGLFQASHEDLLSFASGLQQSVFYRYYNKDNGFITNEFNGGCQPCGLLLKNGYISFPSLNGSVWFNPERVPSGLPDKDLFIDRIEIDQQYNTSGDTINLPHAFRQLRLYVSTPYYGNHYNIWIEFALQRRGEEPVWLHADDNRIISLSSLPSGTSRLLIRKMSGFGRDNYSYKEILINIAPAFFETWWFLVGCTVLLLGLVWLYTKFRFRYIRRTNRVLARHVESHTHELKSALTALQQSENKLKQHTRLQDRLITAIAHDIMSPLKYVSLTGKNLLNTLVKEQAGNQLVRDARLLKDESYRLYLLSANLLQYIRFYSRTGNIAFEKVNLYEIAEEKINTFREIAKTSSTTLSNDIDPGFLFNSNKMLLNVIIHNLLDNATKVTKNGSIRIFAVAADGKIEIIIDDTGPGMIPELVKWCNDPEIIKHDDPTSSISVGLGLLIVKELIASIDGELKVESHMGKGTKMMLIFKEPADQTL